MQLVERHIINHNSEFYSECDRVCLLSKNLYNYANYIVRQEFIKSSKEKEEGLVDHANYINYYNINKTLISENQVDYIALPRKVSNQTIMLLDKNWKSFFVSIKEYMKNKSKYRGRPKLPKYLDKNGRFITIYELGAISSKELRNGVVKLSGTSIKIETKQSNIKQCRVVPQGNHFVIEVVYEKQEKVLGDNNGRYCSIDLGLNNLATVGSNVIKPIIINGKPLKSINQFYNKKKSYYQSKLVNNKSSKRIKKLTSKRNRKIEDYLHKSSRYIINHLVSNDIRTLVIGNNKEWKQEINIGSKNNQNFVSIPHNKFISMLRYKCQLEGITVIITEESYTSKCSFLDGEYIGKHEEYCGKRIKRGLFKSAEGILINADLNGSLNILVKAVPEIEFKGIEVIAVSPIVVTL